MSGPTRGQVVEWAIDAEPLTGSVLAVHNEEMFQRFAALAYAAGQAAEREACAKVCENLPAEWEHEEREHEKCAAAIRARSEGEKGGAA